MERVLWPALLVGKWCRLGCRQCGVLLQCEWCESPAADRGSRNMVCAHCNNACNRLACVLSITYVIGETLSDLKLV
jgi:hypothetical protein